MGYRGGSLVSLVDEMEDELQLVARRIVDRVGERWLELVAEYTPVAEDPFGDRVRAPGTLRDSWELGDVEVFGRVYSIDVFTEDDAAPFVEYPTRPHVIRAKPGKSLRFRGKDGDVVYAKAVNHPGTVGARMMGRAAAQIRVELPVLVRGAFSG